MNAYVLSDAARRDLVALWEYLVEKAGVAVANRMVTDLRQAMRRLAAQPGIGHRRTDLTDLPARFWRVYSYLIVYDPASSPLRVARVLHGSRDIESILMEE